ncbi:uncharacterized protein TRIADDRAFT_53411 [Trichoplax adhaerens]|uniref:Cytochrome P450 n=1 Tax=Trichoplax adhaerens TaxID=10228 RepID=B3RP56_TRIAD|nr:hypothetical protein TRIADDRAFT_53411 [Trichoplax adhaerens]EDV28134.1 hypothetical protein TRIADDRAFT_53411 [Trichoplax adhaerens]|eukprot:XP_002109968.1 hypothetical protein TRIADDRAFT_53411 [Trichoplax adhaerens]
MSLNLHQVDPKVHASPTSNDGIKPFDQIPGSDTTSLRNIIFAIRNFKYMTQKAHLAIRDMFQASGPIVKSNFGGTEFVLVSDPKDIERAYRAEGKYPRRFDIGPWSYYREERKLPLGVLLANDEEWKETRSAVDKRLLKLKDVQSYAKTMNQVIDDFINYLLHIRGKHGVDNEILGFESQTFRWSLETVLSIIFDKRIGCLDYPPSQRGEAFYKALTNMMEKSASLLIFPPYYKYIKTRFWKEFCSHWDTMYEIGLQIIQERKEELKSMDTNINDDDNVDFLTDVLRRSNLSDVQLNITLLELMIGASDTYPEAQEKLYQEISQVLKDGEEPDAVTVHNAPYLRACIKESMRLYPVLINLSRIVKEDVVLSGYHVPANTPVITNIYEPFHNESIYPEPEIFKPERWIKGTHPESIGRAGFKFLPFGFGPRMCIGRRIAELEMHLLLAKTTVIACLYEVFRNESIYPEPEIFKPERWIKGIHLESVGRVGFKFVPFDFGPRMCIGRRIAELEMHLLLAKVCHRLQQPS